MALVFTATVRSYKTIFVSLVFSVAIFSLARFWYLNFYVGVSFKEAWPALLMGLRFDFKAVSSVMLFFVLLGIAALVNKKISKTYLKGIPLLLAIFTTLVAFFTVSNYFYLVTYNNPIDIFAFGLFDGNTSAIIESIWQDYPVLWFVAILLLVFFSSWFLYKKVAQRSSVLKRPVWITAGYAILGVLVLAILARGSLGTFPLRQNEVQVSDNPLVNAAVPNGVIAFYWANKERKKFQVIQPVTEKEGRDLFQVFYGKSAKVGEPVFPQFFTQTPKNIFLEQNPPHVFLGIMESMSTHLLSLQKLPELNVTGALQPHLEQDFLFTRFLSSANGTEPSLAHLLFNSPMAGIAHSKYQKIKLATSIAKSYKEAGYKTVYVTAGSGSWKNLGNYLLRQDFDEVVDQNTIKAWFPEAESQTWGVFDEWGFKATEKVLAESKQPVFVVFLSISNHPPFSVPENYEPYPIALDTKLEKTLKGFDDPLAALTSFQYANDALGKFMTTIKKSELGGKTILAFTGDHNARSIAQTNNTNKMYYYGVPFLVSVPKAYQSKIKYNPQQIGSHKDIAPTLYYLSLSTKSHTNLGIPLLDGRADNFGINERVVINDKGLYDRRNHSYLLWKGVGLTLQAEPFKSASQSEARASAFSKIQAWLLAWQLQ